MPPNQLDAPRTTTPVAGADLRPGFRPDLEGMRAVAVVLVVLYHAGIPWLSGGYVGVDVFFVLSGFLITGLLAGELAGSGTISLLTFYGRRARRLLPAAVLVLVATVVLVRWLLPPLAAVGLRGDALGAGLYASNLRFALEQTDYLANSTPSPLLHYWSLAVEEQFYLVWPLLLLAVGRIRRGPLRRRLLVAVGVVALGSFALSVVLTSRNQPFAFFLLPTRAWELAAGALLALGAGALARIPARLAPLLGWGGLAAIAVAATTFDGTTPFPGAAALLPVGGTVLVLAAGSTASGALQRFLSVRPFQTVGRLSYSIYLWHWPLLVIPASYRTDSLSGVAKAALVVAAVGLAAMTHRLVEDPLRAAAPLARSPIRSIGFGAALTAVAVTAGLAAGMLPTLHAERPAIPGRATSYVPSDLRPSLLAAAGDLPAIWRDGCHADMAQTTSMGCVFGDPAGERTVVLFGDSHAAHWFPALATAAERRGWRLVSHTKSACSPAAFEYEVDHLGRRYVECERWRADVLAQIAEEDAPIVVLSGIRRPVDERDRWEAGLVETIDDLPEAAHPVVLADTPGSEVSRPVCLSGAIHDVESCALAVDEAVDRDHQDRERAVAARSGATFLDPTPWICGPERCPPIQGNLLVWRDANHLSGPFAASLASRLANALDGAWIRRGA